MIWEYTDDSTCMKAISDSGILCNVGTCGVLKIVCGNFSFLTMLICFFSYPLFSYSVGFRSTISECGIGSCLL